MSKIDQKKYLKKYLSGEKKKRKREKYSCEDKSRVKIIDDDIDVLRGRFDDDDELFLTGEDAPQVVGIIDDRAPEIKAIEDFRGSKKWKSMSTNESNFEGGSEASNSFTTRNLAKNEKDKSSNKKNAKISRDKTNSNIISSKIKQTNICGDDFKSNHSKKGYSSDDDLSPQRKYREKSIDLSPPRKLEKRYSTEDLSPPRKQKIPELSKNDNIVRDKRKVKNNCGDDLKSKYLKKYNSSDDDLSPQRKAPGKGNDSAPLRKSEMITNRGRHSSEDLSPPRRQENPKLSKKGVVDNSPKNREKGYSYDYSPPRKKPPSDGRKQHRKNVDCSPKRSKKDISEHSSKRKLITENSALRKNDSLEDENFKGKRKTEKTLDGKKAGLQDAKSLKKESQTMRKKEDEVFAKMPADLTGQNADIIVREKRPKTAAEKRREHEEEKEKSEREREKQEAYSRWGVGLKQIESYQNKIAEETYEISKPLARYSNDADLDEHLKKQERDGDPMLAYIREKNKETQKNTNKPSIPIYKGAFPENRFNIRPGYRWDGVDRSNGYEKKWFDVQNQKKAIQEEAYKYSIEDM